MGRGLGHSAGATEEVVVWVKGRPGAEQRTADFPVPSVAGH